MCSVSVLPGIDGLKPRGEKPASPLPLKWGGLRRVLPIKTMKQQAYGFRDRKFFRLKTLAIHEAKYALVG